MSGPAEKPDDLPDLPIRVRIGLLTYPLFAIFFLCIFTVGVWAGRAWDQGLVWLAGGVVLAIIALLWSGSVRSHRRTAEKRRWWVVEMERRDNSLVFKWEPQTWEDTATRLPTFLIWILVCVFAFPAASTVWMQEPSNLPGALFALAQACIIACSFLVFFLTGPAASSSQAVTEAVLNSNGSNSRGPKLIPMRRYRFPLTERSIHWACLTFRLGTVDRFVFSGGGAAHFAQKRFGRMRRIVIPTRDPDQRHAIADWAASHDIPVTGDI